jgi:hypothetical protein
LQRRLDGHLPTDEICPTDEMQMQDSSCLLFTQIPKRFAKKKKKKKKQSNAILFIELFLFWKIWGFLFVVVVLGF